MATSTGLRDPSQIPFTSDSVWNLPLGSGAQWQYNAQLAGAGLYLNANGNFNEPIYISSASDPLVTITSDGSWGGGAGVFYAHIPVGAAASYPHPGDQEFTVYDTSTNTWFSGGYFNWTGPNTATASAFSAESVYGNGISDLSGDWDQGVGTLRASDLAAGSIDHMLRIEVPTTMLHSPDPSSVNDLLPYAYPGTREDGFANGGGVPSGLTAYTGTIGFGVTVGIPASAQEPADIKANAGADMLWRALQTHGAMVRDSTAPYGNSVVFQTDQGIDGSNPLIQQMTQYGNEIMSYTRILTNQGPNSVNGGGTPIVPLDPPLSGAPGTLPADPVTPVAPPVPSPDGTKITTAAAKPIVDQAGNAWTLVQSATNGLQIAVNGTVDPITANVVLLETTGGKIVQENAAGNWYSIPGPGGAWTQIAAPVVPPVPSPDGTKITTAAASPIIDQSGNAWTLVQSTANGLQIAVNGTVDPITANVVLLETTGGKIEQENAAGTWYTAPGPGGAWTQIASLTLVAAPVTTGTGSDTLVLGISEDAYQGDAQFTVSVDGKQLAGTFTTAASHTAAASQSFIFKGDWATGTHAVGVNFLNDAYGGTAATDRNLYVNTLSYDGTATGQSAALLAAGAKSFNVTDMTAVPSAAIGSGSDALVLSVSEDAYLGNAQFTVSVDGKQLGGTLTATASHASGASQSFTFNGDFGTGSHAVAVNFLNDAYSGTAATDRNLYVNGITYGGTATGQSAALLANGAKGFTVAGGTTPSVSETGDHGSLAKSLSQTGSYTVGGDTFVLSSGNAAAVTLGTGVSQIKFIGAGSLSLTGGSGSATVMADAGANKFVAGTGALDVTGGGGKDAYVFHANGGLLRIEDFSIAKGDTLTVDKALQGAMQQASDGQGGTMLTFGAGATHGVDIHGMATMPTTNVLWA
jgi:hypothetical protein